METRNVIAQNLCELRIGAGLTQLQLAELLNYSDKAVSKWERAESTPDVFMLKRIADYYGVTIDYLMTEEHPREQAPRRVSERRRRTRGFITALVVMSVFLLATAYFALHSTVLANYRLPAWMSFIYSLLVAAIVLLVFNSIWGRRRLNYLISSAILWFAALSLYLTLLTVIGANIWMLFIVAVPAQIIIFIVSGLTFKGKQRKTEVSADE